MLGASTCHLPASRAYAQSEARRGATRARAKEQEQVALAGLPRSAWTAQAVRGTGVEAPGRGAAGRQHPSGPTGLGQWAPGPWWAEGPAGAQPHLAGMPES